MHIAIPAGHPPGKEEQIKVRRGGKRIMLLFAATILTTISFHKFRHMARAEWDTLLFFYGVVLCVGGRCRTDGSGTGQIHLFRTSQMDTAHPAGLCRVHPDTHVDKFHHVPAAPCGLNGKSVRLIRLLLQTPPDTGAIMRLVNGSKARTVRLEFTGTGMNNPQGWPIRLQSPY